MTIIQKLCFPSEEYIEHVFTTLGPLHTATEWTLNILAKWFWSIEKCQQLLSVWAIELTGEIRRLPIACQHGTLALGYTVKPTVNQTNCLRLGPNASTFSLMSVMTRLRKIIRTSDELPVSTFGLRDQLLDQPTDALNSPLYKLIEHSLFTASVFAFPAGQHEGQILLPQLRVHNKLPLFVYVALPLSVVQTWIDTADYRSLLPKACLLPCCLSVSTVAYAC